MDNLAKKTVTPPAICMMIAASISILALLAGQVVNILLFASGALENMPDPEGMSKETQVIIRMCWNLVMILVSVAILVGGIKMMKLQKLSSAKTACILSLIPCVGPCFVLGIPFGIWGLVVLSKPEVTRAFSE